MIPSAYIYLFPRAYGSISYGLHPHNEYLTSVHLISGRGIGNMENVSAFFSMVQDSMFGGNSHEGGGSRVLVPMYIHYYYLPTVSNLVPYVVAFFPVSILIGRPNRVGA